MKEVRDIFLSIKQFESEANRLFGKDEEAVVSRAFNARQALEKVNGLSLAQGDSLKQAVRCVEAGLFKAAFVMAWTGVADLILELAVHEAARIAVIRSKWDLADKTALSDGAGDHAIIEALKAAGIITKGRMKSLHGLLHRRNECAHPSTFFPSANEALGYIDESIQMCKFLSSKMI